MMHVAICKQASRHPNGNSYPLSQHMLIAHDPWRTPLGWDTRAKIRRCLPKQRPQTRPRLGRHGRAVLWHQNPRPVQENNMNETTHNVVPAPFDTLHAELRSLIASSRQRLAGAVNAELTRLYWSVGARLRTAQTFAQPEIVATLSRQLSWSHFVNLLPLKTEPARQFYASRTKRPPSASSFAPNSAANRWSRCKCTKTASPWPNTGPNCHPKRSWSKSCMQRCLKHVSGWRGAVCCWGTWMMNDETLPRSVETRRSPYDFDSPTTPLK